MLHRIARRAMLERGLLPDFGSDIHRELDAIHPIVLRPDKDIRDLRQLCWCSIDHNDTQSLDQLTYAASLPGGGYRVLVAVADVEELVQSGSALDRHARHNTCSIYTSVELFPMLPGKLCNDLTSLGFDEDRRAIVIEMLISHEGAATQSDIYPALVRNKAKLNYNSLAQWLEGNDPAPHAVERIPGLEANLHLQDDIAGLMNALRHEHGAFEYENLEIRPVFENDAVKDLAATRTNRARDIVTEFMIAANGAVAKYLNRHAFPSFRRIVKSPKRWDRIMDLASERDWKLPEKPDPGSLNKFLKEAKANDPQSFPQLSYAVYKLLDSGDYCIELPSNKNTEHFGLAQKDYTHSTAPNRKYPDLITQRLMKAALAGEPVPYQIHALEELAIHCTQTEDKVKKVERQVSKSVAAIHLQSRIGEYFDGIVTGASDKGTWVRLSHPPVEGKLVIGYEDWDVGQRLRVQLVRADVERGFIDLRVVKS